MALPIFCEVRKESSRSKYYPNDFDIEKLTLPTGAPAESLRGRSRKKVIFLLAAM